MPPRRVNPTNPTGLQVVGLGLNPQIPWGNPTNPTDPTWKRMVGAEIAIGPRWNGESGWGAPPPTQPGMRPGRLVQAFARSVQPSRAGRHLASR